MRSRRTLVLIAITLVGGGLRAAEAADPDPRQSPDELGYVQNAIAVVDRGYYRFHYPPGAPALFATSYLAGGSKTTGGITNLQFGPWAQAFVATLLIPVAFLLGWLAAGSLAGLAAAGMLAVYPPLVRGPADLLSEPLAALLLTMGVLALARALRRPETRSRAYVLTGLILGAAALTRSNLVVVPPVLALVTALWLRRQHGTRTALARAGVLLVAALALIVPWSAFATHAAGQRVLVSTGGSYAFFVGTYLPGRGQNLYLKERLAPEIKRRRPSLRRVPDAQLPGISVRHAVAARHPDMKTDAAVALEARRNIRRYVTQQPWAFTKLLLAKIPRMWWRYSEGAERSVSGLRVVLHRILVLASALALLLGLWRTRDVVLALITVVLVTMTAVHMLAIAYPRYALPFLPLLVIGGCAGGVMIAREWRSGRSADGRRAWSGPDDRSAAVPTG